MPSSRESEFKTSARVDLILILVVNLFCLYIFTRIDMLEWMVEFAQDHEEWELDELIPLAFSLAISFVWFAWKRACEARQLYQHTRHQALRDPLTGLYNRRFIAECITKEIANSRRNGSRFAILLMDLDNFKQVNDRYGHNTGDEVLQRFATVLHRQIRHSDVVARWGGEEFAMLCRDTDETEACTVAEKLLTQFRQEAYPEDLRVTATIGIAVSCGKETMSQVLHKADKNLYRGKDLGKDQVVFEGSA
ncbi:GGDEF domain-containing protein [Neptuniibacter halophilus]|uniref:GGDEF domain-containing protein n=1 Tax=Neptuniibacter halophilus TaxID=651666 RepID=UPI0025726D5A|nr:GGDEF domain-containing protein [Neptuniibacter halophilus]